MKKNKSISLKKSLSVLLKKKIPQIKEFHVNCDEDNRCEVGVNITYDDLLVGDQDKIKKEITDLSKMVLTDKGERVNRIYFYDTN